MDKRWTGKPYNELTDATSSFIVFGTEKYKRDKDRYDEDELVRESFRQAEKITVEYANLFSEGGQILLDVIKNLNKNAYSLRLSIGNVDNDYLSFEEIKNDNRYILNYYEYKEFLEINDELQDMINRLRMLLLTVEERHN